MWNDSGSWRILRRIEITSTPVHPDSAASTADMGAGPVAGRSLAGAPLSRMDSPVG